MSQENNEFTFFSHDADATVNNRKAYRASPKTLFVYLEGDNKPHEVCNISVSGISFKLNCAEEQKNMSLGLCIILHFFSDIHDEIITLPVEILRIEQDTCSCFFLSCDNDTESVLDKLILEIQKHEITHRKEDYRQKLEKEKMLIRELRKTQMANIVDTNIQNIQSDNIIEIPSESLHTSSQNEELSQKNTTLKPLSQNPTDLLQESKGITQNVNDLHALKSENPNRKAYRAHPEQLWVYLEDDNTPHKVHNISTAGICFEFNNIEGQKDISTGQSLILDLSSGMRDNMLRLSVQVTRMGQNTCSCFFPPLPHDDENILDKLILEMQKNEIMRQKQEREQEREQKNLHI